MVVAEPLVRGGDVIGAMVTVSPTDHLGRRIALGWAVLLVLGLMLITRKRLWSTDPFTQTHATKYGRWDESKLVAAIRDRQFSQIILRIDVFKEDAGSGDVSPEVLRAVRDSYKLDQRNVENIYVPR